MMRRSKLIVGVLIALLALGITIYQTRWKNAASAGGGPGGFGHGGGPPVSVRIDTAHLGNIDVVIDGNLEAARAHSYITVFQQASVDDAITAITANFYVDAFAKRGGRWSFATRSIHRRLVGDVTQHRRS